MSFPKLTKQEALRLECVRVAPVEPLARALYNFITEAREPKKIAKKPKRK